MDMDSLIKKNKTQKLKRLAIVLPLIIVSLIMPITFLIVGFCAPPQFSATYYAELCDMYDRLCGVKGKKIVIIGSSSVVFGVDSALIEEQLALAGEEYSVVNFGLYGVLGTKIMLDLSEDQIGEGDVVILAVEPSSLTMSMHFSAEDLWYAVDGNYSILKAIKQENRAEMTGAFFKYAAKKYECLVSLPAAASGVYAHSSFDGRCDLKNYDRPYNVMSGGYDINNTVRLSPSLMNAEFIEYINDYCKTVGKKGANVYFTFAPVNAESLVSSDEDIEKYYGFISDNFICPIISNPFNYVMDAEWFYDSNFHLNSAGMTVRTVRLINDIKNCLGISFPTSVDMPIKPEIPDLPSVIEGDNSFAEYFEYEQRDDGYVITSMSEAAKRLNYIVVPYSYNGKRVTAFEAGVFAGNTAVSEIVVQENIAVLYNNSFEGCKSMRKLVLKQSDPAKISVGWSLLYGAESCKIYVPKDGASAYISNYFWSRYAENFAM